ncbi:MAG: hypothetical protein CEN87_743 [Parcubacteria group bacterium Licking1014_1]|nr:MAG: hypothetical protein CEN87_743 [Parcubacteria group bacterium Licking1014_1]
MSGNSVIINLYTKSKISPQDLTMILEYAKKYVVQEMVSWKFVSLARLARRKEKRCGMRKVKIELESDTPLLMDAMSDETLDSLATGVRLPEVRDRPSAEKAAAKIYRDEQGKISLPAEMLEACLVCAGTKVKNGRKQISTAKSTTLYELVRVKSPRLYLIDDQPEDQEIPWVVDKRKGTGNQAKTPTAVCIIRPKFPHWKTTLEIEYNEKRVNGDVVRQLFDVAGSSEGLGSFRPNKRGRFGCFKVTKWEEEGVVSA